MRYFSTHQLPRDCYQQFPAKRTSINAFPNVAGNCIDRSMFRRKLSMDMGRFLYLREQVMLFSVSGKHLIKATWMTHDCTYRCTET